MARYIDADALQRRICGARCGCEYEDCGIEGDCTFEHFITHAPTADVAPRAEVAREIFEEIDKRLDEITVIASPNDCFITTFRKTMEKVTAEMDELKKKYTEGEK